MGRLGGVPRAVAFGVFDTRWQADLVEQGKERFGVQLFDIHHLAVVIGAVGDAHGNGHGRDTGGVGNALAADLVIGVFVIGDVVDEHLDLFAVFRAFDQITDAGFAGVIRAQGWTGRAERP